MQWCTSIHCTCENTRNGFYGRHYSTTVGRRSRHRGVRAHKSALFLSNLNVMDYSLVVGVDSEKKELVVGIVDYIRTFTWSVLAGVIPTTADGVRDKKLESWVKDSAFLGGAGKGEPTIVTPKQCWSARLTKLGGSLTSHRQDAFPDRDGAILLSLRTGQVDSVGRRRFAYR